MDLHLYLKVGSNSLMCARAWEQTPVGPTVWAEHAVSPSILEHILPAEKLPCIEHLNQKTRSRGNVCSKLPKLFLGLWLNYAARLTELLSSPGSIVLFD